MKIKAVVFWVYVVLWCLYLLQGLLFPNSSTITQGILVIVLVWSIANAIVLHIKLKVPGFITALDVFLALLSLYGILLLLSGDTIINKNGVLVSNYSYLRNVLISLLPIYSFYYYSRLGTVSINVINICTVLLFVVATLTFYQYQSQSANVDDASIGEITNNQAYYFLFLLPYSFLFKKKLWKYVGVIYSSFFIFLSMKRGAIIIGAVVLLFILFDIFKSSKRAGKLITVFATAAIVVLMYRLAIYEYETNPYFVYRVEETMSGYSSGRDEVIDKLISVYMYDYSFPQQLFGSGANATIKFSSKYAHNDWLEILINQGLIGIVIFVFFWISLFKSWRKVTFPKEIHQAFGLLILILFFKTLFSMSYTDIGLFGSLLMGYSLSLIQPECLDSSIKQRTKSL